MDNLYDIANDYKRGGGFEGADPYMMQLMQANPQNQQVQQMFMQDYMSNLESQRMQQQQQQQMQMYQQMLGGGGPMGGIGGAMGNQISETGGQGDWVSLDPYQQVEIETDDGNQTQNDLWGDLNRLGGQTASDLRGLNQAIPQFGFAKKANDRFLGSIGGWNPMTGISYR